MTADALTTASIANAPISAAVADTLREVLRRFHENSCYPHPYDCEIDEAANDILFLLQSVNWHKRIMLYAADLKA